MTSSPARGTRFDVRESQLTRTTAVCEDRPPGTEPKARPRNDRPTSSGWIDADRGRIDWEDNVRARTGALPLFALCPLFGAVALKDFASGVKPVLDGRANRVPALDFTL
jgi:hypothetical protein